MNDSERLEVYVRSALFLQGYRLDEEQIRRVLEQFTRVEAIARSVDALPLPFAANAAPVFRP